MLTASQLSYRYGTGGGIKDINLELAAGELVAVLGMNGSGKTTLGHVLSGLLLAQTGEISIDGQPVKDYKLRQRVGYLFSPAAKQFIGSTVEEDILFGLECKNWTRHQMSSQLEQVLADFDLQLLRRRSPETLSQGEMQRAALAAIIALEPEYLILDEPAATLDLETACWLYNHLNKLQEQGMGILVLTNQVEEVLRADRVYLLQGGVIKAEVTREQLLRGYTDELGFNDSLTLQIGRSLYRDGLEWSEGSLHAEGLVDAICRWKFAR